MKFYAELSWPYYSGLCRYDTALPVHDNTAGHLRLPYVTEPTHNFLCSSFFTLCWLMTVAKLLSVGLVPEK